MQVSCTHISTPRLRCPPLSRQHALDSHHTRDLQEVVANFEGAAEEGAAEEVAAEEVATEGAAANFEVAAEEVVAAAAVANVLVVVNERGLAEVSISMEGETVAAAKPPTVPTAEEEVLSMLRSASQRQPAVAPLTLVPTLIAFSRVPRLTLLSTFLLSSAPPSVPPAPHSGRAGTGRYPRQWPGKHYP